MKVALAVLFVLGLAALIVVPIAQVSLAKRRSRTFASFAARLELTYDASWSKLAYRWPGQPFVPTASNQQVKNVLRGDFEGRAFRAFDYSCELRDGVVQDGPQAVTVYFSVVTLPLPARMPRLQVTAEPAVYLPLGDAAFDESFQVMADDDRLASAVFTPQLRNLLLTESLVNWRFHGDTLVAWGTQVRDPEQILARLRQLTAVLEQIPAEVWKTYAVAD